MKQRLERKSTILYEKNKQRHKERRHKSSAQFLARLRKKQVTLEQQYGGIVDEH